MSGDQLWPLLAAAVVVCWLVGIAFARPVWIVTLALGLFSFESVFGSLSGFQVLGISFYGRDAVFGALGVAGIARLLVQTERPRRARLAGFAWWMIIALQALSLVRGVQSYGGNLAGNDFRPAFYLLAGVVGLASHPAKWSYVRNIVDIWIGLALLLACVGVARTLGLTIGAPGEQQAFLIGRPLYAWPTLLIAQGAILSFFTEELKSRWARVPGLSYLLLIAVLVSRQRTVWVTMAMCLLAMWTIFRPHRLITRGRSGRYLAGLLLACGVLLLVTATGKGGSLQRDLTSSAESVTTQDSTFAWRLEGWKELLADQRARPRDLALGIPYGAGYNRTVFRTEVEYSPHSWYVQTVSRVGVLGCGAMIFALAQLMRKSRVAGLLPHGLGSLLVLSPAVYGITYYPPESQGILIGLVIMAIRHVVAETPLPDTSDQAGSSASIDARPVPAEA